MSNELVPIFLGGALIASVAVALLSRRVSVSLIALFYASLILGLTFTFYGDALLGLVTMVTFAGAVSVLLLTVILITGESSLPMGAKSVGLLLIPSAGAVGAFSILAVLQGTGVAPTSIDTSLSAMAFAWSNRPWDLLVLIVVFASAMVTVVNLLGKEK
ncbi:MAG TPA: hypothetical protein VFE91_06945 [Nitrososphaerales archaeon]|nr:hypothetical protein [Nitrososphaerales archaeon]